MAYKTKVCERCGKEYMSNVHNQKYCIDCAKEVKKEYDRKRNKTTKRKEAKKQYNIKNREKIQEYNKEYNKKYKKENRDKLNKYRRDKYHSDLNFKLADWGRDQVRRCLKSNKTKHTFDILGYTPEQLKQRLEIHFKPDMNWENHGTLWHIDTVNLYVNLILCYQMVHLIMNKLG